MASPGAMTRLRTARLDEPAARALLAGLAEEYARSYGARMDGEMAEREADDFAPPRGVLLLLEHGTETVAGGALAPLAGRVAEVKRMWTAPAHRGRGHARRVLAVLEHEARGLGYRVVRLQTGAMSAPALALYAASGYHRIPPFGRYRDEPLAVAFEKRLGQ